MTTAAEKTAGVLESLHYCKAKNTDYHWESNPLLKQPRDITQQYIENY